MRLPEILIPFAVLSSSILGAINHPSVDIHLNPNEKDYSHLKANHQYSYVSSTGDVFLFNIQYKPHLGNTHYFDGGMGYRKFYDQFGIGANLFYAASTNPGFFSHQFSPGIELFFGKFQISGNQYYPLKKEVFTRRSAYEFHPISEFGITFRPSRKHEFGILPFYNHTQKTWGVNGRVSAFIFDILQVEVNPFYSPRSKGVSISFGIHFGGPKGKENQSIRKTNDFHYVKRKWRKNPVNLISIPICHPPEPLSFNAEDKTQFPVIPKDIPKIEIEAPPIEVIPPPTHKYCDLFF